MSLPEILTAAAAVSSPIVSLVVALLVTKRTIKNDRAQRTLDRRQDWAKQRQDRQLASSADFADAAFRARISIDRLNPIDTEPTTDQLAASRRTLEAARSALSTVVLLFAETAPVTTSARTVIDELDTAQNKLEVRVGLTGDRERAHAQADHAAAARRAATAFDAFVASASSVVTEAPST